MFGTGQPTKTGFSNALRFIMSECGASSVLWTNMRQVSTPSNIYLPSHQLCFYAGAGGVFKWAILHPSSARQVRHVSIFAGCKLAARMNENMEFPGVSGEDIEWLQDSFVKAIKVQTVRFWTV